MKHSLGLTKQQWTPQILNRIMKLRRIYSISGRTPSETFITGAKTNLRTRQQFSTWCHLYGLPISSSLWSFCWTSLSQSSRNLMRTWWITRTSRSTSLLLISTKKLSIWLLLIHGCKKKCRMNNHSCIAHTMKEHLLSKEIRLFSLLQPSREKKSLKNGRDLSRLLKSS